MYGEDHTVSQKAIESAYQLIRELFDYSKSFTLSVSENQILFDKNLLEQSYFTDRFVKDFEKMGIYSITFHRRMNKNEFVNFLKFLTHRPGKTKQKQDLEKYMQERGIESIAVDRIRYMAVTGEVDEQNEARKVLGNILTRHPEILDKLLGDKTKQLMETPLGAELPEILPEQANEFDVVDVLSKVIEQKGLFDKSHEEMSEADKQLLNIVETVRENLSEDAKKLFLEKLDEITQKIIMEKDQTEKLLEKEFSLHEISLLDSISDVLEDSLRGEWNEKHKYEFRQRVEKLFKTNDPDAIESMIENMLQFFQKNKEMWVIDAFKIIIELAFDAGDESANGFLLSELMRHKEHIDPKTSLSALLTNALAFFCSLLLITRKFSTVIRIYQEYEKRVRSERTQESLSDLKAFVNDLSAPENVKNMLSTLNDNILSMDIELKALVEKLNPAPLCDVIIDELGHRKSQYTALAAQLLEPHKNAAKQKIQEYISSMGKLNRSDMGFIVNSEQLRRSLNIFNLAVKLDKEWAYRLLLLATNDRDDRIKKHLFFLLMLYPPERVERVIETIFLEADKELREEIIQAIAHNPNPVKDYYFRQIILFFVELRLFIIRALQKNHTEYSKTIFLELLNNWVIYVDPLPKEKIKPFLIELINSLEPYSDDADVKKALRSFRSEWKSESILKKSYSIFSFKKDEVLSMVDEVISR
ncbi:hypothetical protein DRQ33_03445 [bacterium]|nr:MAG: hypothetical protein DRQ33_03445 [bacterium]